METIAKFETRMLKKIIALEARVKKLERKTRGHEPDLRGMW